MALCAAVSKSPLPAFPSQAHASPCKALIVQWALQSLTFASLLQHKSKQQVHSCPQLRAGNTVHSSAKQNHNHGKNFGALFGPPVFTRDLTVRYLAIALFLGGPLAFLRALMSALPPDFPQRWHDFIKEHDRDEPFPSCKERKMGSTIYDRHGQVITTLGAEFDSSASNPHGRSSEIPAFLWQAVVACEDRRFFQHRGIDPRGLARAALSLSSNGGGSTITQQLAKNVFLTSERKWTRKLMEMLLALILESRMSKWDILCAYLKKIYWGHGVYGIESASDLYFRKPLSRLKVGECAMLAGMIPAPEFYSPFRDLSRGKRAQARALCRMIESGFLDASYAEVVMNEPLELSSRQDGSQLSRRAPYFVDEVVKVLKERYGCSKVLEGGLKIYTTLDLQMQEFAEKVVRDWLVCFDIQRIECAKTAIQHVNKNLEKLETQRNIVTKKVTSKIYSEQGLKHANASKLVEEALEKIKNKFFRRKQVLTELLQNFQRELSVAVDARLEAALTAIDPSDGAVHVLIGGRDYLKSCFNRSTQAYRPPGLTFVPVVYLAALKEGISLKEMLRDQFRTQAANFSRKRVGEMADDRTGFKVGSSSAACAKLCAKVGVDKVYKMGKLLGLEASLQQDPMVASGGCKVTPLQLASVYSTIAARGTQHKPFFITRVETQDGEVLEEHKASQAVEVVDEHVASKLSKILQVSMQQEMGQNARRRRPFAGKSGTSEGHRDAWFAGFAQDLSCVAWLGYDDKSCVGGLCPGTGASHAIHIWTNFMNVACKKERSVQYLKNQICHKKAMKFPRKSFKVVKIRRKLHHKIERGKLKNTEGELALWKDVWDWDKASHAWDERESMVEWTRQHLKRVAKVNVFKKHWS